MQAKFPITPFACYDEAGNFAGLEIAQTCGSCDEKLFFSVTAEHPGPHQQQLPAGFSRVEIPIPKHRGGEKRA